MRVQNRVQAAEWNVAVSESAAHANAGIYVRVICTTVVQHFK